MAQPQTPCGVLVTTLFLEQKRLFTPVDGSEAPRVKTFFSARAFDPLGNPSGHSSAQVGQLERRCPGDSAFGILKTPAAFILVFSPSFPAASQGEVVAQNGLLIGQGLTGHV